MCHQAPAHPKARRGLAGVWLQVLLVLLGLPLGARDPRWTSYLHPVAFEHLSGEQGLSQSIVHRIAQDHRGFLWFATDAGLNRYDGYRFLVLRHDKLNPGGSLAGDRVNYILEDRRKILWIATNSGLSRLNPETLEIQSYYANGEPGALPSNSVTRLAEDHEGNLWMGTEGNGLFYLPASWNPSEPARFRHLSPAAGDAVPSRAPKGRIWDLLVDRQGALWVCSVDSGLGRLKSLSQPNFEYFGNCPGAPQTRNLFCVQEDPPGGFWVGSDSGLYRLDLEGRRWERFLHRDGDEASMPNNVVYSMSLDRMGALWLANDGAGVSRMLPRESAKETPQFQCFRHDPKNPESLSGNGIQCVFEDSSGVLWVSAYQTGLNKLALNSLSKADRTRPIVFQHSNRPADPQSLSGNQVAALCQDRFGNLWVGTDGFGVNRARFESSHGLHLRFDRFLAQPNQAGALQDEVVLCGHLDSKGRLWLGTYKGGLVRVDQAGPQARPVFTHFRGNPANPKGLGSNFIRSILDGGDGRMWIATGDSGLSCFDPETGEARRIPMGLAGRSWMRETAQIDTMAMDRFGMLWMATPDGLNRLNPRTGECRGYVPRGPGSLGDANVLTLRIDHLGDLWVGTGAGLQRAQIGPWEGPEPQFVRVGREAGLPESEINNILEDKNGRLWISTTRQIWSLDPQAGKAQPFPWQNSLRKGEFIKNSACILSTGEILFGSNNGFSLFHPDDIAFNPVNPSLVLTEFQVLNQDVPLKQRLRWKPDGMPEITVKPYESTFTVAFSALHYVAPDQNRYRYRLEGLDSNWNEAGNRHSISFAHVPPGYYTLRVRGTNCDGLWGTQELNLAIRVLPAWYQTWWFRGLLGFLCLAGAALGGRWYMASLRRRNLYLEEAMAEQARRLHEAEALNAMVHLSETSGAAGDDLWHWVHKMSLEVARAVDADRIDVWEVAGGDFKPVTDTQELPAITHGELALIQDRDPSQGILPVLGPHGDVHAALRIQGKQTEWTTLERQVITSFMHHLGGAYHLQWLKQTLVENRSRRALERQALLAQGAGVLQMCPVCNCCYDESVTICAQDQTPLVAPRVLPYRFQGRYRLVRLLGEGGTAHVFEAWDEKLGREVALKAIKPHNFAQDQTRERFTREARVLARLDHPGIVSIHDSGELEDGTVFLVMERLRGRTVGSMLRAHGPARPRQAAFMLRQVATALASTHAKGLVHRDLKPDNLFATFEGEWIRYKVLDFGLAKGQVTDTELTQTGTLMGTPNYMSPEQVRGLDVDWRSDLYSLAAIMYEVLSGRKVAGAETLAEVFVEVLSREPRSIRTLQPDCPVEVEQLLAQGLAKDPGQRAGDLLAWAGRLDIALQGWALAVPGWPEVDQGTPVLELGDADPTPHPAFMVDAGRALEKGAGKK